ncbi:hypothetical protein CPLU01_12446 [Colletotrichum plurivorum]|uniref:Uncharacterized protein n=1 Tax=Colletotrichum plurivorum TaxID=2175906 RepID=A0A8H6N694_9PEZI|nr:hypothetical protein CPLU01_12446 [Colletotrichum plurivorum]
MCPVLKPKHWNGEMGFMPRLQDGHICYGRLERNAFLFLFWISPWRR